jgi:hypothetical protein
MGTASLKTSFNFLQYFSVVPKFKSRGRARIMEPSMQSRHTALIPIDSFIQINSFLLTALKAV